jgi:hypothetical protein
MFRKISCHIDNVSFAYLLSQSEYRKVQKHSHNRTLLVTIPTRFADAISINKNSVVKMTLENNRITMEKA